VLSLWMVALFCLVSFAGWHLYRDMTVIYDRAIAVDRVNHRSHLLHDREMHIRQMVLYVHAFLITGSDHYIQRYVETFNMVTVHADGSDIGHDLMLINRVAHQIFNLPFVTDNTEGPMLMETLDQLLKQLSQQISNRHQSMDGAVNRSMNMISALNLDVRDDSLLALFILLLVLIAASSYLYKQVVYPLTVLRGKVAGIGEGNFVPDCPNFGDNEIGELSLALNRMGEALTERDQALVQAKSVAAHQEKMHALGLMTASIAHEVGNPLSAATVSLDVCLKKMINGDQPLAKHYLKTALNELRRTENIIRNVLDFGRYSSDEQACVNVAEVIESALHLVRLSRGAKGLKFCVLMHDGLPMVRGSEDMIRQVLVNLLLNASDVSRSGDEVTVRVAHEGDMLLVDVVDQGDGIPLEMCEQIFSPQFTTKPKGEGSGLGLAISRDLMRRMFGDLILIKNGKLGCLFRMTLPTVKEGCDVTVVG